MICQVFLVIESRIPLATVAGQCDAIPGHAVLDNLQTLGVGNTNSCQLVDVFLEFPDQHLPALMLDFKPGKIPQPGPTFAWRTTTQQYPGLILHHDRRFPNRRHRRLLHGSWNDILQGVFIGWTQFPDRTGLAVGILGHTDQATQLHQCLVKGANLYARQ